MEQRKQDLPFKTPEEALVLASIVEKETGARDERETRGGRVRQPAAPEHAPAVGSDRSSTGSTGAAVRGAGRSRGARSTQKTAHNTYQIDGLPPTPICNPGRAAIEAALNPADTKELYFVADGTGGHIFSETLKDHNAAVKVWRAEGTRDRAAKAAAAQAAGAVPLPPAADEEPETPEAQQRRLLPRRPRAAAASAAAIPLPMRKPKKLGVAADCAELAASNARLLLNWPAARLPPGGSWQWTDRARMLRRCRPIFGWRCRNPAPQLECNS